jgi:hypothetical protein
VADVPVFVILPERLDQEPAGPYLMDPAALPAVGDDFTFTLDSGGAWSWWQNVEHREVETVRWHLLWPMRSTDKEGTIALVVTLSALTDRR